MKSDRSVVFLLNSLGLCFRDLRQLDSSDYYFRKELLFTRIKQDSIYEHITLGNLGENQYLRGNYDEAIPLLFSDAEMASKVGDFSLASNALILIGDIYTRKGQYRKADSLLTEGLRLTRRTQSYRRKKKAFPIMARLYLQTGRPELAALFLDSSNFVADSLVRLNNQSKISAAEAEFAFQNLKIQAEREASDLRLSRLLLASGLLFTFMLGLIGLFYFQRYRISARLRQLELQANLEAAENDLEAARRKLDEYLKQFSVPASADVNWTESRILTRENWLEFKKLFSASFPGFLENIPKKFPQLTEGEIRYCCLLRLNLKVKDIALILGVNENSAYRNRSRLLSKTDLPDDKALLDILLQP
jgi:tetratricopeptide (TPR) repeat protein